MFASRRLFNVILAVAIAGLGFAAYSAVGPPAAAKAITSTAAVTRGDVLIERYGDRQRQCQPPR